MIRELLEKTEALDTRIAVLLEEGKKEEAEKLQKEKKDLLSTAKNPEPGDRVFLARHPKRPHMEDFVSHLFSDFFEQKGDHLYDEDHSIYGGIARFHGKPVTVIGHRKGRHGGEPLLQLRDALPGRIQKSHAHHGAGGEISSPDYFFY